MARRNATNILERPNIESAPEWIKTQAEVARVFGVKRPSVNTWTKAPGFPEKTGNGYSFAEVLAWLEGREAFGATDPDYDEAKRRKMLADAQRSEFALAQQQGQLIDAVEVEREWTATVQNLDTQVKRKGQNLAKKFLGAESAGECVKIWETAWREIRKAVAVGK